jgi:hypothetical protein
MLEAELKGLMESPYLNEDAPLITFEELNEAKE